MLQIFSELIARARSRRAAATAPKDCAEEPSLRDPIDHPAFKGMTMRELADIPFPRHRTGVRER